METNNNFLNILHQHEKLSARRNSSDSHIKRIQKLFLNEHIDKEFPDLSIFIAGSIGRKEAGTKSDLDIFLISNIDRPGQLDTYKLMAKIIGINKELGFPDFSNDGMYLKIQPIQKMREATGSPIDDSENMFTTRMLLLLESQPACNAPLYHKHLDDIVSNYFRDAEGRTKEFKPMFLLNDLLRYWRTLCLNYEGFRNNRSKPWRKRNVNLKFSRMLTVFGTVLPLLVEGMNKEKFHALTEITPLERMANSLSGLCVCDAEMRFKQFLDDYELFLSLKEKDDVEAAIDKEIGLKTEIDAAADRFSTFIYDCLMSPDINSTYKKYLVI